MTIAETHFPLLRVLIASGNKNKIREIISAAQRIPVQFVSSEDLRLEKDLSAAPEVDEDGETYLENAVKKASGYSAWSGLPSLADDTGLEVPALGNKPGLFSARYAGKAANDWQRMTLLLDELRSALTKQPYLGRTAYFRCALALVYPDGRTLSSFSAMKGYITEEMRGDKGFGYDPIFEIDGMGKTLAEVDFSFTCMHGFRAVAVRALFGELFRP